MEAGSLPLASVPARASRRRFSIARVLSLALTLAAIGLWVVVLRPDSLGGPADYVIVAGHSMEPTFQTGDVVVAFRQRSYAKGDIVVYRVPAGEPGAGDRVIHRIVGGSGRSGFAMRGDNKDGVDPWRPTRSDVIGKARVHVPQLGFGFLFLRTTAGVALIAGMTTFLLAVAGGAARPRRPRDVVSPRSRRD